MVIEVMTILTHAENKVVYLGPTSTTLFSQTYMVDILCVHREHDIYQNDSIILPTR